ncbi:hypothetical protein DM78_2142 [Burkholderia mallei]|nr:hypothetical protein DM78_2142 [Burkholderia mallei]
MDVHARQRPELARDRRREAVVEARRGRADDHDLAAQLVGVHAAREHVDERDRRVVLRRAAERDEIARLAVVVLRDVVRAPCDRRGLRELELAVLERVEHGHHQLRPAVQPVALEQRDAAHDAVRIDFEIDVARARDVLREHRHGRIDGARAVGLLRAQQHGQERRHEIEHLRERAVVGGRLGKQHVVDDGRRMRLRERAEEFRMDAALPWPAPERVEAAIVDLDDHDVRLDRQLAQREQAIVDDPVDARRHPAGDAGENHRDPEAADRDPLDEKTAAEQPPPLRAVESHPPPISARS